MPFGLAVKTAFSKLFVFEGRARRSEFWWFYLLITLLSSAVAAVVVLAFLALLLPVIRTATPDTGTVADDQIAEFLWSFVVLYGGLIIVGVVAQVLLLGAEARRLHDTGQSAHFLWFHLAGLGIVPLIMCIMEGEAGPNQWGPNPKTLPAPGAGELSAPVA